MGNKKRTVISRTMVLLPREATSLKIYNIIVFLYIHNLLYCFIKKIKCGDREFDVGYSCAGGGGCTEVGC
jgi:hypothetical protein